MASAIPSYNKYGNTPTHVDGIRFASKKEAKRYVELKLMAQAGLINDLALQQRYPLYVNSMFICNYIADFVYKVGSHIVVEDVKGKRTEVYRLKRKLMEACHGIVITEV